MMVVVSPELFFEKEAQLFNALFENGLNLLHLRKPNAKSDNYEELLGEVKPHFRDRIVLHQHHFLAEKYGIHRLHFSSVEREFMKGPEEYIGKERVFSTSIHGIHEYKGLSAQFSYAFLSPVFDSISKPGYRAKIHDLNKIKYRNGTKLIGLGGVHAMNCKQVFEKGYDGIGLCGTIWSAANPVQEYLKIEKECRTIAQ